MRIDMSQSLAERDFDRSLIRWIMSYVGNPRISIRLWNGDEFWVTEARPIACMEFCSRRAVFELLRSPSVGFGDCYSKGLIEVHGDFLAFVNEITAALTRKRDGRYYGPKIRSMLHAMRANTPVRSQAQRSSSLRPRQRLLQTMARRAHGLHLRLLRRTCGVAGRGPGRQARTRVPQAESAGPDRRSSRRAAAGAPWRYIWPNIMA